MPVAATTRAPDASQPPTGWRIAQLGDVANVVGGSTPSRKRPECWGGDIPWIVPSELTELAGRYLQDSRESITMEGLVSAGLRVLPAGSVLLTTRATVGLAAINALPVTTNQGFQSLVGKNGTDSLWLYYCISSKKRELERRGAGSTFREVSRDGVRTLPILLPPLSEQRAIAAVLDSIDETIERADEVIAATERLRDALLHELLTRGLPGQHSEWKEVPGLGTIPASWDAVPLREVLVLSQPGAWGDEPSSDGERVRVLRAADLTRDGRVNPDGAAWRQLSPRDQTRRLMRDGDLMLERSGGGPGAPVGRVALIEEMDPVYCNNFCQQLRGDHDRLSPKYTLRALWHRYIRGVTARLEHQTTGIRNLDFDGYLSFPIPLPSLQEQRAIAEVLDSVDVAIERACEELCELRSLQASTADALLTGRLRVEQRDRKGHGTTATG